MQSILWENCFAGLAGGLLAGSTLLNFFSDAYPAQSAQRGSSAPDRFWIVLLTGCYNLAGALPQPCCLPGVHPEPTCSML